MCYLCGKAPFSANGLYWLDSFTVIYFYQQSNQFKTRSYWKFHTHYLTSKPHKTLILLLYLNLLESFQWPIFFWYWHSVSDGWMTLQYQDTCIWTVYWCMVTEWCRYYLWLNRRARRIPDVTKWDGISKARRLRNEILWVLCKIRRYFET